MAREGIPTGEHPPGSILMGGATRGSPGVPHDVRKLIFPTIATPWDPWINRGYCTRATTPATEIAGGDDKRPAGLTMTDDRRFVWQVY